MHNKTLYTQKNRYGNLLLSLPSPLATTKIINMKNKYITIMSATLLLLVASVQFCSAQTSTSIGAKYHPAHSEFLELPYDDGDMSVGIAYSGESEDSVWQLAVDYAWDLNGSTTTDYIITPQINLLWKDRAWFGGVGIMSSYIEDMITGDDWTDIYYQLIFGVKVPFYGTSMDLGAHYEFESWNDLGKFDFGDLTYGIWLNLGL